MSLVPYPETQIKWLDKVSGTFELVTPWITVSAEVDPANVENVSLSSEFLREFTDYPIYHSTPRKLSEYAVERQIPDIREVGFDEDLFATLPTHWGWKVENMIEKTTIEGTEFCDALSVLTWMRRLRILTTFSNRSVPLKVANLKTLKQSDLPVFIDVMRNVLKHSLYVTSKAIECIEGAINLSPETQPIIEAYVNSERGYDVLVKKSLLALGGSVDMATLEDEVCPEMKTMMAALKYAASNHLISFAALLEGFEGLNYDEENVSIWDLLEDIPEYPNASRGVKDHSQINKKENHSNICLDIASLLPPVSKVDVVLAARIAESVEYLRQDVFEKIYSSTVSE